MFHTIKKIHDAVFGELELKPIPIKEQEVPVHEQPKSDVNTIYFMGCEHALRAENLANGHCGECYYLSSCIWKP